jgi:hypothetical protein
VLKSKHVSALIGAEVLSVKGFARGFYGSGAKGESAMGYQEDQRKLNTKN